MVKGTLVVTIPYIDVEMYNGTEGPMGGQQFQTCVEMNMHIHKIENRTILRGVGGSAILKHLCSRRGRYHTNKQYVRIRL